MVKRTHQFVDNWLSRIENIFIVFSSVLLFVMVFIITLSVIGRFFFNSPFAWSVEFSEYIMLYVTMFSVSWILRQSAHVKLEILIDKVTEKTRKLLNLVTNVLGLVACAILTWFASIVTFDYYQRGLIMYKLVHMPEYIVLLPIAIGSLLLTLRFFTNTLSGLTNWKEFS